MQILRHDRIKSMDYSEQEALKERMQLLRQRRKNNGMDHFEILKNRERVRVQREKTNASLSQSGKLSLPIQKKQNKKPQRKIADTTGQKNKKIKLQAQNEIRIHVMAMREQCTSTNVIIKRKHLSQIKLHVFSSQKVT